MLKRIIIIQLALGMIYSVYSASNCPACTNFFAQIRDLASNIQSSKSLLEDNKRALNGLKPTDTSKRVKISSNIFILTAKLETLENNQKTKTQEALQQGCNQCPK